MPYMNSSFTDDRQDIVSYIPMYIFTAALPHFYLVGIFEIEHFYPAKEKHSVH